MKYYIVLFLSLFVFSACTREASHEGHDHSSEKSVQYTCPMHPEIIQDKPGSCPICGMDLVLQDEVEEDESEEAPDSQASGRSPIHVSAAKKQMIGVKTVSVEEKEMSKRIQAPGRVAFDPELYNAKSEYLEALRQWNRVKESPLEDVRRSTQGMIRSARIRLRVLGLSEDQINKLTRTGKENESLILGEKGGKALIYADVYETELAYVEAGLSARVTGSSLEGGPRKAKVLAVDSVIDPQTRTARVRLELESSNELLRPESYVSVEILSPLGKHLAIPREAILNTGKEELVFVEQEDGHFVPRVVYPKIKGDQYVALSGELKEGDKVVTEANFMIDSEARLKAVANSHKH